MQRAAVTIRGKLASPIASAIAHSRRGECVPGESEVSRKGAKTQRNKVPAADRAARHCSPSSEREDEIVFLTFASSRLCVMPFQAARSRRATAQCVIA